MIRAVSRPCSGLPRRIAYTTPFTHSCGWSLAFSMTRNASYGTNPGLAAPVTRAIVSAPTEHETSAQPWTLFVSARADLIARDELTAALPNA